MNDAGSSFDAVVFDLFGTLVPEFPLDRFHAALARAAGVLGADPAGFRREWEATALDRQLGTLPTVEANVHEILRRLGQFRSLIFARTPLDLDAVLQAGRLIREIWCVADEWARRHPDDPVTALGYRLTPDRLILEFYDTAGWLAAVPGIILFWIMMRMGLVDSSIGSAGVEGEGEARSGEA